MKILLAIPHYFDPDGGGQYSSLSPRPQARVRALITCVAALYQLFGKSQYILRIRQLQAVPVNLAQGHDLDVVICTTNGKHLLSHISLAPHYYTHCPTSAEPLLLGFACQAVLRERLGSYDYYCYLEDDLILNDPWFFRKLAWFNRQTDALALLQPNRYEIGFNSPVHRLYIDGDLPAWVCAHFQNAREHPEIRATYLDGPVRFTRTQNPHSGCYFLTAEQMKYWARQPYFLDGDTRFMGPLESAATLGIMRTFRVYKPAPENPDFLEIQHHDIKNLVTIGKEVTLMDSFDSGAGPD